MRQWILITLLAISLAASAQQFGPAKTSSLQMLDDIAVVINNESLTRRQLDAELRRERRLLPKNIALPAETIQEQLTERIIISHLLTQLKQRLDITTSDEEIDQAIASVAQQNGVSVGRLLQQVKRDTGLDEATYRAQIADTIAQEKLKRGLVQRDINVTPADIDAQIAQIARQENNIVQLQDLLLPSPAGDAKERGKAIKAQMRNLSQALSEADGDLQKVSASIPQAKLVDLGNVSVAQIPVRFAEAIATLPVGELLSEPVIDRDGMHFLKVTARQGQGAVIIPEANVEHILLRATGEEDFAAQKIVITELYQRLQQGEDFNTLAAQYSQDPISASRQGKLGWMSADQVVPAFAEVMLSTPLDTISQPFRSAYGWHILRVKERREVDRADDILRARIRESLYQKYLEDAWQQRLIQLRQQAYIEFR